MSGLCQRLHGCDATNDDWDSVCGNDCGKVSGGFILCSDCASGWCKSCIERTANDLGGGDWRCPECQREVTRMQHTHTDVQLEDAERIVQELVNAATVVGFKPEALPEVADEDGHPDGTTAAAAAVTGGSAYASMYVGDLRALLRSRKLSAHGLKSELISRLVQDDGDKGSAGADEEDEVAEEDEVEEVVEVEEVGEAVLRARDGLRQRLQDVLRKYLDGRAHKMRTI